MMRPLNSGERFEYDRQEKERDRRIAEEERRREHLDGVQDVTRDLPSLRKPPGSATDLTNRGGDEMSTDIRSKLPPGSLAELDSMDMKDVGHDGRITSPPSSFNNTSTRGYKTGGNEIHELQAELKKHKDRMSSLENELDAEKRNTTRLRREHKRAQAAVRTACDERHTVQIKDLEEQLRVYRQMLDQSEQDTEELEEKLQASRNKADNLERQLREARRTMEEYEDGTAREKSDLVRQLREAQRVNEDARAVATRESAEMEAARSVRRPSIKSNTSGKGFISVPKGERQNVILCLR